MSGTKVNDRALSLQHSWDQRVGAHADIGGPGDEIMRGADRQFVS
jgi:hypothetical protein